NNQRSSVLRMIQGKARALVGKLFAGLGSKFEVHTPTAVAAARGTYFVVWIEEKASQKMGLNEIGTVRPVSVQGLEVAELQAGGTGVANIGRSGNAALRASDHHADRASWGHRRDCEYGGAGCATTGITEPGSGGFRAGCFYVSRGWRAYCAATTADSTQCNTAKPDFRSRDRCHHRHVWRSYN